MNEILKYFVKSLSSSTQSLKKKGILVDKPWALIDDDGAIQKLIFKKDNGLILAKNGKVSEGTWEYFPEAKALLIDRGNDKLLLKEQFIDENVIILKKDGTENDFYALANENTLPDYNIAWYLNTLRCKELKICKKKLYSGDFIQIHNGLNVFNIHDYYGHYIELTDQKFRIKELDNGHYLTEDKLNTFYVKNNQIVKTTKNVVRTLDDQRTIEIENGDKDIDLNNLSKKVTINGKPVLDARLKNKRNIIYVIKESAIQRIFFLFTYELKTGQKLTVEQQQNNSLSKGDQIVESYPNYPMPDGSYRIKGRIFKINIKDNQIS